MEACYKLQRQATARAQLFFEPVSSAVCYHTLLQCSLSFGAACVKHVCLVALGAQSGSKAFRCGHFQAAF